MKGLILAEKPSLMKSIKNAYQSDTYPFHLDFTTLHGHLMELAAPETYHEEWGNRNDSSILPIIPESFRYQAKSAEIANINKILNQIKVGHYDFIVNACDAGREGELIFWSFYETNHLTLPVKRLWCSTTIERDLKNALHTLRDYNEDSLKNLKASSEFRARLDWLSGINFSRAISIKTHKFCPVGRVVTPTLNMVVTREKEIENFVPEAFFEVQTTLIKDKQKFPGIVLVSKDSKQTRFPTKEAAEKIVQSLEKNGTVASCEKEETATNAPTLYSTLELQKDANKYFKFRATKTDAIAQELYEAGYISYPRTSCRFIPSSIVPDIPNLLKPLQNFPELTDALKLATPAAISAATTGKKYVDASKLTDHHAIIPTITSFDPATLSADQQKIYLLVAKRFLSIFLPPYKVAKTTVLIDCGGNTIYAVGRMVLDKGFSMLYQDKSKDVVLPSMKKGDIVDVTAPTIKEGTTTPPSRYTDRTLLEAMANAGKFVSAAKQRTILRETDGIGTDATRSSILAKLEEKQMVRIEKGFFIPTEFGRRLIEAIGEHDISSPSMTADWETTLRKLEEDGDVHIVQQKINDYIQSETQNLITTITADLSDLSAIGKCPICGAPVISGKNFYLCKNYKAKENPCTFVVSKKETMGTTISDADMENLLNGRPTEEKTLTSKAGKKFKSALIINENGRLSLAIGQSASQESVDKSKTSLEAGICKCPCCENGNIYESKSYWMCTNRNDGCGFIIPKLYCDAPISSADVKKMVSGKETAQKSFTWKSGKKGKAKLKGSIEDINGQKRFKLSFIFDN